MGLNPPGWLPRDRAGRLPRGVEGGRPAEEKDHRAHHDHVQGLQPHGQRVQEVHVAGEIHGIAVEEPRRGHAEDEARPHAEDADLPSRGHEDAEDHAVRRTHGLEDPDLAPFLQHDHDQGAHDVERGHEHDEKEDEPHAQLLDAHPREQVLVEVDPRVDAVGISAQGFQDLVLHRLRGEDVGEAHLDGRGLLPQPVEALRFPDGDEGEAGVVFIEAGGEDAGDPELADAREHAEGRRLGVERGGEDDLVPTATRRRSARCRPRIMRGGFPGSVSRVVTAG